MPSGKRPLRIALIQARSLDESLALCDVAAILHGRGHLVRLFLEQSEPRLVTALRSFGPEAILVQAAFMAEPWLRSLLAMLPPHPAIMLVGTQVTFDPSILIRHPRAVGGLRGELDDSLPALISRLEEGEALPVAGEGIPGFVRVVDGAVEGLAPAPGPADLDDRPLPLRGLYFDQYAFMGRFPWKRVTSGRGCIHACGYCYLPPLRALQGDRRGVRRKSVGRVIAEVQAIRGRWPLRQVHFADDLFAPKVTWLEDLAQRWPREVGLPFSANTSPETVTERNARLLAKAGARLVGIGIECAGEDRRRERLGRRSTDDAIRAAVSRLDAHRIRVHTFNILGSPGETLAECLQTLHFNQELGVRSCRATLALPLPGSQIERRLMETGVRLDDAVGVEKGRMRAVCTPPADRAAVESLCALFRFAVAHRLPAAATGLLARAVPPRLLRPLTLYDAWTELRWSGVTVPEGLRFAVHAGRPVNRVTYHESLP